MNKRLMAILAVGTAAVLMSAGCSGSEAPAAGDNEADEAGGGGGGPLAFVAEAVNNTDSADSYTATMTMSGTFEGVSVETTSDIEYVSDPEPTMRMTVDEGGVSSEMLMRGSEMLMSSGGMGGAEWLRIDGSQFGSDLGAQDPASEVDKLLAAQDVEETGSEDVNGVATTVYAGSYSTDEALAEVENQEMADAAEQIYADAGVDTVDFEVFIDDEGMPRRLHTVIGDMAESTFDFVEFNQDLAIEYPSEDQIQDFSEVTDMPELPDMEEF